MAPRSSDWLVHRLPPVVAVLLGFVAFVATLGVQLRTTRYRTWAYWSAVAMVGIFGTMAADVLHVGLHVPYSASTVVFAIVLSIVFTVWRRTEGTLSVHDVTTTRRELFYWAAVVSTFALGTAAGDLLATTLGLGYWGSAVLFAVLIAVPAIGYRVWAWNGVACFWTAYVLTRPLGASLADWFGKPRSQHGLGVGAGVTTAALALVLAGVVTALAVSHADDPAVHRAGRRALVRR